MCGIGGVIHARRDHAVLRPVLDRMLSRLGHRGPDGHGTVLGPNWGFCHTRLAVLDTSDRARQPMESPSGRYVITYNGEIYNFREIRHELRSQGREFKTTSDTEVILQLIEGDGADALTRLEGMFSVAIYDRRTHNLLLVRDRMGIKPLFWAHTSEGVAFASEPKALLDLCKPGSPKPERLAEYLCFRHLADEEFLCEGIRTLPPGHRLWTDGRQTRIEDWASSSALAPPSAAFERVVQSAVRRQLVSDVPVGVFLSGGNDSALVAAAASEVLPELPTFTVGFHEKGWDESERARLISDALRTRRHELRLHEGEFLAGLGAATWYLDAPLNHAHSVYLLELSRFARQHITVAMTGEGSDEMFGGYPRYRLFLLATRLWHLPSRPLSWLSRRVRARAPRWGRLFEQAAADDAEAAARNASFVPAEDAVRLTGAADVRDVLSPRTALFAAARSRGLDPVASLLHLEQRTYLVSLLQRMDRMSMAAGLECRVPLLDESVVAYASSLASKEHLDLFDGKKPIRRAVATRFGSAYARAPKSGFGVPLVAWFRGQGPMAKLLARNRVERETRARGWIDVQQACRLADEHRSGARDHTEMLWGLLNLEIWARVCLEGNGPAALQV